MVLNSSYQNAFSNRIARRSLPLSEIISTSSGKTNVVLPSSNCTRYIMRSRLDDLLKNPRYLAKADSSIAISYGLEQPTIFSFFPYVQRNRTFADSEIFDLEPVEPIWHRR
jgi:hypothetical protein